MPAPSARYYAALAAHRPVERRHHERKVSHDERNRTSDGIIPRRRANEAAPCRAQPLPHRRKRLPFRFRKAFEQPSLLEAFLGAKRLEGCSERSLRYYSSTLKKFIESVGKPLSHVSTDDVREYLANYQALGNLSNVTADNVRRVISSLFSWLEIEDLIYKSPVRRIKKIRTLKPSSRLSPTSPWNRCATTARHCGIWR